MPHPTVVSPSAEEVSARLVWRVLLSRGRVLGLEIPAVLCVAVVADGQVLDVPSVVHPTLVVTLFSRYPPLQILPLEVLAKR